MKGIQNLTFKSGTLKVQFEGDLIVEFETIWLRDHCRCSLCYRSDTFQRVLHLMDIPESDIADIKFDKDNIYITWDDKHDSIYKAEFLVQFDYNSWVNKRKRSPVLWSGEEIAEKVARVPLNEFLNSSKGARTVFQSLLDYGIAMIENVEPTTAATEEVCNALGGVQRTIFGGMWLVHTQFDHADTAYTNIPLATHTDNTYFTEAAGLQIFQGLDHTNGCGGETILVDGFYGAQRLKKDFPEDYEFLTTYEIEAEYIEENHYYRHCAPVIIIDKMKDFRQIRFNVYDRSPMAFSSREDCKAYYRSLKNLSKYYNDVCNQWQIKLKPEITAVTDVNETIKVFFRGDRIIEYAYMWLRDHCRCSSCYRFDTCQRAIHLLDVPDSLIADLKFDKENLYITWDDKHESIYKADFLIQFDYKTWVNRHKYHPVLWCGDEVSKKLAKIPFHDFHNSSDGARSIFKSLLDYGIAIIENVEPTTEGTEKVCNALGGVQYTMYGKMWLVRKESDHADVAYTNASLASHTDATYFTEAAGLLIFQCLEHRNGRGGETTLVDGFYCAQRLKKHFPEDYEFLTKFEVDAEFVEKGHFQKHSAPVIIVDKNKDIIQIRFNSYDRAPTAFSNREESVVYYRALKNLSKYFEDTTNQWQIKLRPGMAIAIDNFRILHGRTSFSGDRVICGGYVSRTDWLDRARTLKVIK